MGSLTRWWKWTWREMDEFRNVGAGEWKGLGDGWDGSVEVMER